MKIVGLTCVLGIILASALYWKYQQDIAINKEHYVAKSHLEATKLKDILQDQMLLIYQGIRTIANLPAVRMIKTDQETFDANVLHTIRDIFDNLSNNVGITALYFIPSQSDELPNRLDTHNFKPPYLVLNPEFHFNPGMLGKKSESIMNAQNLSAISLLGKESTHYSQLIHNQLKRLHQKYPKSTNVRGVDLPAIISFYSMQDHTNDTLVTPTNIKNSEKIINSALIYTVPFYGSKGDLKGVIAAVLPLHQIRSLLKSSNNVMVNAKYAMTITPELPGAWANSMDLINSGLPDPDLLYSETLYINIPDVQGPWYLWSGKSNAEFWISSSTLSTKKFFYGGIIGICLLTLAIFMFLRMNQRQQILIIQKNVELEKRVEERTRELKIALHETEETTQALSRSEERQRTIVTSAIDGIMTISEFGAVMTFNPAAETIFGYTEQEVIGTFISELYVRDDPVDQKIKALLKRPITNKLKDNQIYKLGPEETVGRHKNGSTFPMEISASKMSQNNLLSFVVIVRDISKRKLADQELKELHNDLERRVIKRTKELAVANEELEHQALHDPLTDLPNRVLLQDRLHQAILSAQRENKPLGLLVLDLDRFKEINDTLGHHYGDILLQQVANRMCEVLRESDTVARFGGDEFAIMLPNIDNKEHAIDAVNKLLEAVERPFILEEQHFHIGFSVGIAMFPDNGADYSELMRHADVAMYVAKRNNVDYVCYDPSQDDYSISRLALMGELRHAIDNKELFFQYQPKIDLKCGHVTEVEALMRWQHPEQGLLTPNKFIPLAEQTGLIKPLAIWSIKEALRQCNVWHRQGYDFKVCVNLSARNLHDTQLPSYIEQLMKTWEVSPEWLVLEITESAIMSDPVSAMEILTNLHEMGVVLSIDDFGTGYSSLSYLKQIPVDEIKIDKTFVVDMATNKDDLIIVRSTIDLAHNMGRKVIAEGVESKETLDMLINLGCDMVQGNYISEPLTAAKMRHWLYESNWGISCIDLPWGSTLSPPE